MLTTQMFILKPIMDQEQEYYTILISKGYYTILILKGYYTIFNIKGRDQKF